MPEAAVTPCYWANENGTAEVAIRTSMSDYRQKKNLVKLPLYAISQILNEDSER